MKILHTADVHLNEFEGQRWQTFEQILNLGKKEKVDVMVISGDLFDQGLNAVQLRREIEALFSDYDFQILILPGNHDFRAFKDKPFWGNHVQIFNDLSSPWQLDEVTFWGLPFEDLSERQVIGKLETINEQAPNTSGQDIFVYHGELVDAFYSGQTSQAFGDEGEKRYLPMKLAYFKNLNFDYILAGHFHSQFDLRKIDENKFFVYPGSPISITKRETGPRKVNLFEVGQPPKAKEISTPYFTEINYQLNPFEDQRPIEEIKTMITKLPSEAVPIVSVKGYFDSQKLGLTKKDFVEKLNQFTDQCLVDDVSTILSNSLFKEFVNRMEDKDIENKEETKQLVIETMMEAKVQQ